MKKEYINPEVKVVRLQTMTVLAGSPTVEISTETVSTKEEWDAAGLFGSDEEEW